MAERAAPAKERPVLPQTEVYRKTLAKWSIPTSTKSRLSEIEIDVLKIG
jgi:hypothetical protein